MKECNCDKKCVCKDKYVNEEDLLNDIMLYEKNISNNYSIAINEMSNKILYKKIINIFLDTKNMAREIFNFMYNNEWYTLEAEDLQKIKSSYNKYKSKLLELK